MNRPRKKRKSERPTWQVLSYWTARGQWRKTIDGKDRTFGPANVKPNRTTHDAAMRAYLDYVEEQGRELSVEVAYAPGQPFPTIRSAHTGDDYASEHVIDGGEQADRMTAGKGGTVGEVADAFTADYKARKVDHGNRSAGRYGTLVNALKYFRNWHGDTKPIASIDGATLSNYHGKLMSDPIATETAISYLNGLRQFIRWAWEREHIATLPRNIDSSDLAIARQVCKPVTYTDDEIHSLLSLSSGRMRLFLLLMLNCSMSQQDISDLKPDEVEWTAGTVTRKRSKTAKHANAPTVTYKLWPVTLRLLKEYGNRTGPRVLMNDDGGTLITSYIENGEAKRNDNIKSAFGRLTRKLANRGQFTMGTGQSLKTFRNTFATRLTESDEFSERGFVEFITGHAPTGIVARHYADGHGQAKADKAIAWLGKRWKVDRLSAA